MMMVKSIAAGRMLDQRRSRSFRNLRRRNERNAGSCHLCWRNEPRALALRHPVCFLPGDLGGVPHWEIVPKLDVETFGTAPLIHV